MTMSSDLLSDLAAADGPPVRSRRRLRLVVAAVVLTLVAGAVVAISVLGGRQSAGAVIEGAELGGPWTQELLPLQDRELQVDLSVNAAVRTSDGVLRPPLGGAFVAVRWRVLGLYRSEPRTVTVPTVTLRSGGLSRPLALEQNVTANGELVVAVDGDGQDAQVVVELDGRTQTFGITGGSDLGDFAGFRDSAALVSCPDVFSADRATEVWSAGCSTGGARLVPWIEGRGWAATGRQWLVLGSLRLSLFSVEHRPSASAPSDQVYFGSRNPVRGSLRHDDREPVLVVEKPQQSRRGDYYSTGIVVFDVPVDAPITPIVRATFVLDAADEEASGDGDLPSSITVPVEQTVVITPA